MVTASEITGAVGESTLPRLLRRNATEFPDLPALTGSDTRWTWRELRDEVLAAAHGLAAVGLRRGDRMLIAMSARPEHWVVDFAAVHLGAIPCTTYATLSTPQIQQVARHSGATVVVLETASDVDRWRPALAEMPALRAVVLLDRADDPDIRVVDYTGLVARDHHQPELEQQWIDSVQPDDPVAMIYTSGTTGDPKGVVLSHRNVLYQCASTELNQPGPRHPRSVAYLPLAHVAERVLGLYMPVYTAGHVTICSDQTRLLPTLIAVRPHGFFGVPRVWEKFAAGIQGQLSALDDHGRAAVAAARKLAAHAYRIASTGDDVPADLARRLAVADQDVLRPLRERLGLADAVRLGSGSAPVPAEVLEFFGSLGLTVMEVWGLSETTGTATSTHPDHYRAGTVGLPVPGMEIRLAADGEVLVRGPLVFLGYLQADGRVEPAVDADGWLATGDLGALDPDGLLRIVGRKKELIITASGKNIAPTRAESLLRAHPLIDNAAVIGDRRPYLTALLVLDEKAAAETRIHDELTAVVDQVNAVLSRPEQIKAFHVVDRVWSPETGELTPTLKLRRQVIEQRHAADIEALYPAPAEARP
nr:AMP-dependent synthetase/ligase [Kibdelosporangium sp. MJ126-NF4]CEL19882.1 Long-chain-fatty-acid--CoA ligase [Kibdelosporangium sp. MJ126-NF4]CTQ97106.1 Long-chain-fatty-acid--CoA ligase (EC 6.2.1.3) [Kibdelosporangium sp. MJ126-NF4]